MELASLKAMEGSSSLTFSLQALLIRHEAYISDSEAERTRMAAHIESLESDKQVLERKNATAIEENRALLDQLEALNNAVIDSDAHVTSLQATLASTQREMQKLTHLASRTEDLERQLIEYEREQVNWQDEMEAKEQSERSAVRRWQTAERTLNKLEEQIESIEREAREERERHAEIVGRMERRHAVERELRSAAGRLKGAAALKNGDRETGADNGVVSHFVKDILQDNTNLQMGIVELREMLNNSNEEVENLRGQLSLHQPANNGDEDGPTTAIVHKDLGAEMTKANSQELHVHHHYHAPPAASKPPPAVRKPRRKRYGAFSSGHFTPSSGASTPRSSFSYSTPTSAATILHQTAASVPSHGKRLSTMSTQSNQTFYSLLASSGPTSPQSQSTNNRTSSIFDRVFSDAGGQETSRPTTPDTEEPGSPMLSPSNLSKRGSGSWSRTYSAPVVQRHELLPGAARPTLDAIASIEELPSLDPPEPEDIPALVADDQPPERAIDNAESQTISSATPSITSPTSKPDPPPANLLLPFHPSKPSLRRATSHDSLFSIAGMDIHTPASHPHQLLAPYANLAGPSQAVLSGTTAHAARPMPLLTRDSSTGRSLLSGMAADQRQPPARAGLGAKVGGWMFGKWGVTPATTTLSEISATASSAVKSMSVGPAIVRPTVVKTTGARAAGTKPIAAKSAGIKATSSKPVAIVSTEASKDTTAGLASPPKKPQLRPAGINQSGPMKGFFPAVAVKPQLAPVLDVLDEEGLANVLAGA